MSKRRKVLVLAVVGLLLVVLGIGAYGGLRWQQLKRELGIVTLDVSGVQLSANQLEVRQIVLVLQPIGDERLSVRVDSLRLDMESWWRPLTFQSLSIKHLEAQWRPASDADAPGAPLAVPDRQQLERWATWAPRTGHISSFGLTLPCESGTCREQGEMSWQHTGEAVLPATLKLQLRRDAHQLALMLGAHEQAQETHVDLQLQLDGQQRLTMQNQLTTDADTTLWRGTLAMSELPEAPWLMDWLGDWLAYEPPTLPELPERMRIGAGWALQVDTEDLAGGWKTLDGEFRLSANLPAPWPVVGIGQVQGRLDLTAKADRGTWIPTELTTDLLLQPAATLVAELPAELRPDAVSLQITPAAANQSAAALPLQAQLAVSGPTSLTLHSQLVLGIAAPYRLSFEQTRLRVQSAELALPEMSLKGLEADLRLHGHASAETAAVRLDKGSQIALTRFTSGTDLVANRLQLNLSGFDIETKFSNRELQTLSTEGQAAMTIAELRQPALRPQGWRWSGRLDAGRERLLLEGPLSNDAGLTLPLTLDHNWSRRATRLNLSLPELFLRAGNPLAATFADWPQVLELNTGRLQGQGQFDLPSNGPLEAKATLSAKGLGGIYDRTELRGLNTTLSVALRRDQLRLEIPELTLQEANPGFSFGPLRFNGEYAGNIDHLDRGRLAWTTAELQLLGGRLWLDPGKVDLAAETQQLNVHLRGLQLPLLLEAYPTEGLSGTGVIDGELQLQRSEAGISIEKGSLKAREPGGTLQFRSAKIQALGQSNPAMRLVTEALDDFHYDLLASDVHYATDGTLNLGLKLHGQNPALEGGRPINFSINLEEDIPALLTSLQLSDRVSETIQRRVQERLRPDR
jgi:hypothetical protein